MKKLSLLLIVFTILMGSSSCKKEVSPELVVTVVNNDNEPLKGRVVKTSVRGAEVGILNGEVIDSATTDVFGKAFFEFKNTILIDLALYDNSRDTIIRDSTSVLLETKRQRGDKNVTERKMVIR